MAEAEVAELFVVGDISVELEDLEVVAIPKVLILQDRLALLILEEEEVEQELIVQLLRPLPAALGALAL